MLEEEKMLFAEHLSLMLRGGAPLAESLETLKNETKSKVFQKTIANILKGVLEGESLNKGLSRYPKVFNQFFQNIVKIGEESGNLEENLNYLAVKLKKDEDLRKKVKGALIYPAMIIILALFIAFAVTFFILPKITNLFKLLEIELPLATKILIAFVSFFQKYWLPFLVGLILVLLVLKFLQRLKAVRFCLDRLSLSLPFLGKIFRNLNLSFFSRTFFTLLKSGVPINQTLEICSETLPNEIYKRNLLLAKSEVEKGEKVSKGLKNFPKNFPAVFTEMLLVGERSGNLEDSLSYLAEYYEKETETTLKDLSTVLEPLLLILVGIFVGFVAVAIITPIYRFTGQLKFR